MECLTLGMNDDVAKMGIIFGVGGAVVIIALVLEAVQKISVTRQRETTKREVAAYVAEGSMTPEDAERIIKAGKSNKESKS
jgi:shikimate 5-dehydrogenase